MYFRSVQKFFKKICEIKRNKNWRNYQARDFTPYFLMPFFSTILFHLLRGEEKSGYEPATPFSIIGLGEFSKEIYLAEN